MSDVTRLSSRLEAASDDHELSRLGFRADDRDDIHRAVAAAVVDPKLMSDIETLAGRLRDVIGDFEPAENPLDHPAASTGWGGVGVIPLLALLAVVDDTRAFHYSRGISRDESDRSLADIGQQAWVHRRTFGAFGLHTYSWVAMGFSGNLYWLGRLQYNLVRRDGGWALSTHIPETGPLTPESADESFTLAAAFFAEHFADYPTDLFHCGSWLLDPQLVDVLRPESNMVKFQQRWTLDADLGDADADAIFFVFRRRGEIDRSTLPQETSLQRAIVTKIDSGGHWHAWSGTQDQAPFV